jgi:DNA-directed RNA polymerase specialized sigma24 family protein
MRGQPDVNAVMNETGSSSDSRVARFTEIFGACYGPVLAYARRRVGPDLAQDVVSDTFLAAWRSVEKLPPEPLPWLYRAGQFAIANQRGAAARREKLSDRARLDTVNTPFPDLSETVAAQTTRATAQENAT